jgi:hypothetical protein
VLKGWPETTFTDQLKRKELAMLKNYVLSDMVTKAAYFSFVAAAFVFVTMLLMTSLHP